MPGTLKVEEVNRILDDWSVQTAHNVEVLGAEFPDYYDLAVGDWVLNGGWTEGFWTGILWLLFSHSKDDRFKAWARFYTRLLAARKADFADHDLGFLFYHSCALENLLTGDEEMVSAALAAARRLGDRFNTHGRFIRAHGALTDPHRAGYAIIDTIMNLRLLFWAHEQTGERRIFDIAQETASTIATQYVREDWSTYQVVWFDPTNGKVEKRETLQGYSPTSCWSRGQAWGIYGFAQTYKYTGAPQYREISRKLAQYFLDNLPADGVVHYDFDDPRAPNVPKDTSAQSIAAAGLLVLSELTAGQDRVWCFTGAQRLLRPLCDEYVVRADAGSTVSRGLLKHGCYFWSQGRGVDSELMFGDYYMVEALTRFLSSTSWN